MIERYNNPISVDTQIKLEKAFLEIEKGGTLYVLGKLTNKERSINVYLIAKEPSLDIYYYSIESSYFKNSLISVSLKMLSPLINEEVKIDPFTATELFDEARYELIFPSQKREKVEHLIKHKLTRLDSFQTIEEIQFLSIDAGLTFGEVIKIVNIEHFEWRRKKWPGPEDKVAGSVEYLGFQFIKS